MATICYATTHQDDETLSKGASIRRHLEAGHDVHVLLLTTGERSGARDAVGLSVEDFVQARDDEMIRACRQLGVPYRNVHLAHATADGDLTVGAAETAIRAFLAEHPGAWVKTYSHLPAPGRHPDHVNTGQAAVNLWLSGEVDNLRLYIEPWLRDAFVKANSGVALSADHAIANHLVRAALKEYQARDGAGEKFGIGWNYSVPAAFQLVYNELVSWYHLPPARP